ncbi:MAG: putative 2-aminoethylphosphonate ABC transporter ATP-binding protein [Rhodospirillales bacterium]|nr:MAG: putative 2-aminoethylphosphonate ABC transporter ATP-binding protein [Rhodospirillales bacterium]
MFLEALDLTKRFGTTIALDAVSLDVAEGEFVCFLGPSGCGKTTLLRCIAGLETHDSGTIRQRGQDITHQPPEARDFGIVFQSYALFPNLSIEKNVGYGLNGRDWPRARRRERVAEMMAVVGLEGQEHKYPSQLSGGQQQRVALARALAPGPSLLLLDEPLSALDAKVRERLRREIKGLQRRLGVTTIMVTHDQEEALSMADRVVVMSDGRIEQVGSPAEVYSHPCNPFVADFIGTMNFLPAESSGNGRLRLGDAWDLTVDAGTAPAAPAGPVTCCVRPQHLALSRNGLSGVNAFPARVRSIEYLGSMYRAVVSPEGLDDVLLRVDLAPEQLMALTPAPDDRLTLHLPPESLRLFAASAPALTRAE